VGRAEPSSEQGGEVDGPGGSEHGERRVANGLSYYCTIEDYMERMLHQTVANDQNTTMTMGVGGHTGRMDRYRRPLIGTYIQP